MNNFTNEQLHEWVELYCLDLLEGDDKAKFETSLMADASLRKMVSEHNAFVRLLQHKTNKELVSSQLHLIRRENKSKIHRIGNDLTNHINKYWKTASIAAGVAFVASLLTFSIARNRYETLITSSNKNLALVANEVTKIKKNMNKQNKRTPAQPKGSSKQSGTCFVLDNNGYAITNAHVIGTGNNVYIFTNDGIGHQAKVVNQNNELDLALLKIEEKDFIFSDKQVPYSINTSSNSIAQRVYTLGYPKSSIVYSEGYVSSEFGRDDDSSRYQLMLPSEPGVSGSPVFDEKGNVTAIINSRESIGNSTTYALKGKKVQQFLKDNVDVQLPTGSLNAKTRSQQIKMMQDFVCVVKVY
jgi:serine protease Do